MLVFVGDTTAVDPTSVDTVYNGPTGHAQSYSVVRMKDGTEHRVKGDVKSRVKIVNDGIINGINTRIAAGG